MKSKKNSSNKPRARVVEPDDDDDNELLEAAAADEDTDLDEELRALDEELGADASTAKVVVHKVIPNGDSARCFSCPRSQFFSDQIREQWGAGTYSILVYLKGKIKARHRLTFAEPSKPVAAAAPAAVAPVDQVRDLEARFERDRARDLELMKLFMGRPQSDPLQMQTQILSMLTTVKDLTGGTPKSSAGDRSAIDLVLEGVKLAQRLGNGGSEGSTDWGQVVASAVEGVRLIAEANPTPAPSTAAAPPKLRVIPGGAPPVPAAPSTAADSSEESNMIEKLRVQLQLLVRKAEKNLDPELYAEVAIDNIEELPAFMQTIAIDYLKRPDALERLISIEPAIANHREWFQKCIEEIRALLSPEEPPDPLTGDADAPESGA